MDIKRKTQKHTAKVRKSERCRRNTILNNNSTAVQQVSSLNAGHGRQDRQDNLQTDNLTHKDIKHKLFKRPFDNRHFNNHGIF